MTAPTPPPSAELELIRQSVDVRVSDDAEERGYRRGVEDAAKVREALVGLLSNIKMHHDGECPGITPADCLDAIYESANIARAILAPPQASAITPEWLAKVAETAEPDLPPIGRTSPRAEAPPVEVSPGIYLDRKSAEAPRLEGQCGRDVTPGGRKCVKPTDHDGSCVGC